MDHSSSIQLSGYQHAVSKTAYYQQPEPGFLKVSGEDRRTFLQRQTSNNVDLLSPERSLVSVLTSPTGRILDILTIIDQGEVLGVETLPGQGPKTHEFLRSRIFFMDTISLEDVSSNMLQVDLVGPEADQVLQKWGVDKPGESDELHHIDLHGAAIQIHQIRNFGYRLITARENKQGILTELTGNKIKSLDDGSYEVLRIERGIPAAGHELTDEYTPLETGYHWAVSDNKGCYTGQEILARQTTYDKITRKLVGLFIRGEARIGDPLFSMNDMKPVGKITSLSDSPRFGTIALAIVKRSHSDHGEQLRTGDQENGTIATVTETPFQELNN